MEKSSRVKKRWILFFSLISNLAILFFFKYANFFNEGLNSLFGLWNTDLQLKGFNVLLPVGISFYTFQALGYSIDVYKKKVQPEHNFVTYALFVTFFPQLVAGPIERTEHLLPQFKINHKIEYERVTDGLKLAAWGMFKKVVVADQLATYVNIVYNDISNHTSLTILLATFFFSFQILCDFSGYSDIAIGVSKVLGFNLMTNFERPYFSKSIIEFWRRWHISLSSWFKDYVYIPLGGNKVVFPRRIINILITFIISGLWHGANLTFIIWGGLHGLYQILSLLIKKITSKLHIGENSYFNSLFFVRIIKIFITFNLVCFAWIFFRANSVHDAFYAVQQISIFPQTLKPFLTELTTSGFVKSVTYQISAGITAKKFFANFLFIAVILVSDFITRKKSGVMIIRKFNPLIRWILYYLLIISILYFVSPSNNEFIYFQF